MRRKGINYDVGIEYGPDYLSRPEFDPATTRRELAVIRDELHCTAVRISGTDPARLTTAADLAAGLGLEVWLSPHLHDRSPEETIAYARRCAADVAGVDGLVFVLGCELTIFMQGIVGGATLAERLSDPLAMLSGAARDRLNAHLTAAAGAVREVFDGPVTYASAPIESVNWELFDYVCLDHYRDSRSRDSYGAMVAKLVAAGRPVVLTEVGCCTYRGAEDRGGMGWSIIDPDDRQRINGRYRRDEALQAREVIDMLTIAEREGVDGVFVFTFVTPALPHREDPAVDLDLASYAVVKTLPDGTWEPKELFHALAAHYGLSTGLSTGPPARSG